ncbi:hypothetical protein [Natrinema sp. CBA1119]|uniref:hypothetical protein n=1 Tax=Natrinema sp. CBA1119 TaxID=1608465 RepID=UPI0011457A58|nr:hypothetical protein [Natrinema sp. CBA1119]
MSHVVAGMLLGASGQQLSTFGIVSLGQRTRDGGPLYRSASNWPTQRTEPAQWRGETGTR